MYTYLSQNIIKTDINMQTILVGIACAIERLYASTSSEFYLQHVQSTDIRKQNETS